MPLDQSASLAHGELSVYGPDHHADGLHRVEASTVVGPEDAVLEFAAVDASGVPDTVEVGLATSVVPPASFVEMGTVTCNWETGRRISSFIHRKYLFSFLLGSHSHLILRFTLFQAN